MPILRRPEPHLPTRLICNRNFILLWAAYGISAVGDHLSEMALLVERDALGGERATRIQALLTFGFFLPFVILAPLAGWWADRFSRKWTMIATDILRAGVMFSLIWTVRPLVRWLDPHGLADYAVVLPLLATGALAAFFSPARQAMLPTLIRPDQLVRANALTSALGTIGAILSAVLGGYLVKYAGTRWNYTCDSLTFLLSAGLLLGLVMARSRAAPHPPLAGVWAPVIEGFRYVNHHRRVLQMIVLGTVFWAAAGVVISVVPALVRDVFHGDIADAGLYRGLIGVGLVLGAGVMTIIGPALPLPLAVLLALAGGTFWLWALAAVCALRAGAPAAGVCLVGIGGAGSSLLVTIMAAIQRFVPDARRGRVCGVSDMCTMAAIVAATAALGLPDLPHIDRYVPALLAATGGLMFLTLAAAWATYRRGDPQPPLRSLLVKFLIFHARLWRGARRVGICTVPRRGPVIVAALDAAGGGPPGILATCTHRLPRFVVAGPRKRTGLVGWLLNRLGPLPLDLTAPSPARRANCAAALRAGECVAIFVADAPRAAGQSTVPAVELAALALQSGATVVPCHISGGPPAPGAASVRADRRNMRVCYGRPLTPARLGADRGAADPAPTAANLILAAMRKLSDGADAHAS